MLYHSDNNVKYTFLIDSGENFQLIVDFMC